MTVFECFKNKNIDELVDWLNEHCVFDHAPWYRWWDENYCNKCESIIRIDDDDIKREYGYCELNGNCKFFKEIKDIPDDKQVIKMWLESESKE